jgi:hypothetical protein
MDHGAKEGAMDGTKVQSKERWMGNIITGLIVNFYTIILITRSHKAVPLRLREAWEDSLVFQH